MQVKLPLLLAFVFAMFLALTDIGGSGPKAVAQGPSSRGMLPGAMTQRTVRIMSADRSKPDQLETVIEEEKAPIPDMFRTEAPLVERNIRFDYRFSNHLYEPLADQSEFATEISYSFNEQFGLLFSAPYLSRDDFGGADVSGFGDIAAGARYVAIGSDEEAEFKLAFGLNVVSPTGNEAEELGEGFVILEPELLTLFILTDRSFAQGQLSLGIPTVTGETTELEYNSGLGYVFKDFPKSDLVAYPTLVLELNGFTGIGGEEAGTTILDVTNGLRWWIGKKMFAGVGASFPITGQREFESQFIFSLVYLYGEEEDETKVTPSFGAPTSRGVF